MLSAGPADRREPTSTTAKVQAEVWACWGSPPTAADTWGLSPGPSLAPLARPQEERGGCLWKKPTPHHHRALRKRGAEGGHPELPNLLSHCRN